MPRKKKTKTKAKEETKLIEVKEVKAEVVETLPERAYQKKTPAKFTNKDVEELIEDYIEWLGKSRKNISWSSFCRERGIKGPYRLKSYLMANFTGLDGTIDFKALWEEAEYIREEKLTEIGIFSPYVNSNFLLGMMKSKFGWHDNVVQVGLDVSDIIEAKKKLIEGSSGAKKKKND